MNLRPTFLAMLIASILLPLSARGDDQKERARIKWEAVVLFFGDEETGEWSLRLRDQDVTARSWFEFQELWQFDIQERRWKQLKMEKFAKAVVLPSQKRADDPAGSQSLVELKEIEPRTAGLWWAKWRMDEIDCGTMMRVGTWRATSTTGDQTVKAGLIKVVVPIDLNKSTAMVVPDPRLYCVAGGPGKPEAPAKAGAK